MTGTAKTIYTIDPGIPFVDALARGIVARIAKEDPDDPMALARLIVLVPTRRAVRSLSEAFLRTQPVVPMLLPRMAALGDLDEDEILMSPGLTHMDDSLPPVIGGMRRQLKLARLVMEFGTHGWGQTPDAGQAAELALELARFLDQMETEGIPFTALNGLEMAENLADHWQKTLNFLEILTEYWPRELAEEDAIGPAEHRNRLLKAQSLAWQAHGPKGWVIAAGSTGSIPATADLLDAVAGLEQGCVVLPGLDRDMNDDGWDQLGESHPQFGLAHLLKRFGLSRANVADFETDWPHGLTSAAPVSRVRLLASALAPVPVTPELDPPDALEGLTWVDCPEPSSEAGVIALMMRKALETPGGTAALVTPDRALARRVASRLGRWEIDVDDSAGTPLGATKPAVFFLLLADMVATHFAPVALLSCLKHPLASGGEQTSVFRARVRELERLVLRGPRPAPGFGGITAQIKAAIEQAKATARPKLERLLVWFEGVSEMLAPLVTVMEDGTQPLGTLVSAHVVAAETMAGSDEQTGAERLWAGDDGEALASFVVDVREASAGFPPLGGNRYTGLLQALLSGRVVRPRYGRHPRLFIWGPLEARLQNADLMILGGLNEGAWPLDVGNDPWMSRPMRDTIGLPQPERRIGLSAHDFTQAFAAPEVVLTRAERVEGTPQVASRWLLRLANTLGRDGTAALKSKGALWLARVAAFDAALGIGTAEQSRPAPKPPVSARPRRLSVTQIETLQVNPYAIYARHVLELKPLDGIDADAGAAERGSFIHLALQTFVETWPKEMPPGGLEGAVDVLKEIGHDVFAPLRATPGFYALWWPRFERVAVWFAEHEIIRRAMLSPLGTESWGTLEFETSNGPFKLTGMADRIDREIASGTLGIVDYKTGKPP
ncbi:MAG: double-strand break repair protein AddB, partial [Rhodospirillales bacterium]|nr:double-strand break repair protein AddB [Rhodospirillales bacterium]